MAGLVGDFLGLRVLGVLVVAGLSLMATRNPGTPPFARRAPTSSSPQLGQHANAGDPVRPKLPGPQASLVRRHMVRARPDRAFALQPARRGLRTATGCRSQVRSECLVVAGGRLLMGSGGYLQRDLLALIRDG
jgi:hypothetical protein